MRDRPLVRLFARERLHAEEAGADQQATTETMIAWLLRMATTAGRRFEPAHGPPERREPGLATVAEAEQWLRVNVDNWLGVMRLATERGRHAQVLDCAESMHWFSDRWMHGPHWQEVFTPGERAAQALGDAAHPAPGAIAQQVSPAPPRRGAASLPQGSPADLGPARMVTMSTNTPPSRLTIWAGHTMILIAVLHTAVFARLAPWSSWLAGDLRDRVGGSDSMVTFWALPGGFVVVLVLLGLLVSRAGRQGQHVPGYVGWALLGWAALAILLIGPSGFLGALIPAGMLIAANFTAARTAH
ncbi:DUF6463 family protein [Nonomuraea sp. NPDC051191]|uniref:DUF6463 family protein n=1 Tax=Nonomuraea sp. NPDC051191 TaxID=3364372 RepID=UPI00379EAEDF